MTEMEVVMIDKFGSREVMKFRKVPIPAPGPNEILLKVKAPSLNPVDWKIREGQFPAIKSDKLPYVLGRDESGVVEACGTETNRHRKGDEIYAMLGSASGFGRGARPEVVREARAGRSGSRFSGLIIDLQVAPKGEPPFAAESYGTTESEIRTFDRAPYWSAPNQIALRSPRGGSSVADRITPNGSERPAWA